MTFVLCLFDRCFVVFCRETRLSHGTMDPRLAAALRKTACPGPGPQCRSDPIELSNACRAFYNSRLESARVLRERWSRSGSESYQKTGEGTAGAGSDKNENCRKKSSIDIAMDTLRQEMVSLGNNIDARCWLGGSSH